MSLAGITEKALRAHSSVIQSLAEAMNIEDFCTQACRIINREYGFDLAWLALAPDGDTTSITPVAADGKVPRGLEAMRISWLADPGRAHPALASITNRESVLVDQESIGTEDEAWYREALRQGCRSSVILPMVLGKKVTGLIALYSPVEDIFTTETLELLEELARDLAFGVSFLIEREERENVLEEMAVKDAAMDTSLNAILIADHRWRTTYANQAFLNLWGYITVEELLGLRTDTFWDSADESRQVGRALIKHGSWYGEMTARRKDGTTFMAELRGDAVTDSSGYKTHFMVVCWDITSRKEVEAGMLIKDAAIESSLNGILISDGNWRTTYVNPAFLELWGFGETREVIGLRTDTFWDLEEESRNVGQALLRDGHWYGEMTARRKDGTTFFAELRGNAVADETGYKSSFMVICSDITSRKESEAKLQQSLDEKEVLLQEVHHRVKNNLQAVCGLLNLQGSHIDDQYARSVVRESEDRIRSMALIHEKLYQMEDLAHIDMKEYLTSLVAHLGHSGGGEDRKIRFEVDARPLMLNLDTAIPCGLIVNELVNNSLKYAFPEERSGTVKVTLSGEVTGEMVLVIADDGVGLPLEKKDMSAGSMGLTLVRSFVEGLSGTIEIDRNGGTTFTIRFSEYKGGGDKVVME
jgi:PAS domain S-box-containing protein